MLGIKCLLVCTFLVLVYDCCAQHPTSLHIITTPQDHLFTLSGMGVGNLYQEDTQQASSSGNFMMDWVMMYMDSVETNKVVVKGQVLSAFFKYNPTSGNYLLPLDSMGLGQYGFSDHIGQMTFGARWNQVWKFNKYSKPLFFTTAFLDFSTTPYLLDLHQLPNTELRNFNLNIGYQAGYALDTEFGLMGVKLSGQLNFLSIYDRITKGEVLERVFDVGGAGPAPNKFIGLGSKISLSIKEVAFHMEFRRYFPMGNNNPITHLTDRMLFSLGGSINSTIFTRKNKKKPPPEAVPPSPMTPPIIPPNEVPEERDQTGATTTTSK